jgi:hypothetical protein
MRDAARTLLTDGTLLLGLRGEMRVFNFNFRTPASGFIGGAREHLRDQSNVSLVTGHQWAYRGVFI